MLKEAFPAFSFITAVVQMDSKADNEITVCRNISSEGGKKEARGCGEYRYNIFSLPAKLEERYEESANAANSWLHLHNTHQACLSLRRPVNSRPKHAHIHTLMTPPFTVSVYIYRHLPET